MPVAIANNIWVRKECSSWWRNQLSFYQNYALRSDDQILYYTGTSIAWPSLIKRHNDNCCTRISLAYELFLKVYLRLPSMLMDVQHTPITWTHFNPRFQNFHFDELQTLIVRERYQAPTRISFRKAPWPPERSTCAFIHVDVEICARFSTLLTSWRSMAVSKSPLFN